MRFGTVSLIGRSNVGKSTFLNWALGQKLAITSPLPQTTRDALLGVVAREGAQMAFLDTPGVHKPRTELGRRMNAAALDAARAADVVAMMTDSWTSPPKESPVPRADSVWIRPGDRELIEELRSKGPSAKVLLINKVDLLKDKRWLLPMIEAYRALEVFDTIVPISVRRERNLEQALDEVSNKLPEGPPGFDEDTLTNRPVLFFVREYIREAILNQLESEVPHAVAVSIDRADERPDLLSIAATVHVEKLGQRKILVGQGGQRIKEVGIAARTRISELVEKRVYLELFVRISPRWKDMPRQLAELGYDDALTTPEPVD